MQVKRLKLSGFKSFVEPAELSVEPGLTGLVGPNGCGKSNVLEAIRWVMGESSPKSMRGAGMDDVIFAGTALRPAREFAEVSMLVEREPGDISGDASTAPVGEVEVTRRIERGAGSAYRVNGRDVRQKDVALLFADAATGAHSPALVSQGKISAVISAKPTERRCCSRSGRSGRLARRRKDAEQKLRAAEANRTRIDEMLADMEQRSAALRRQARAAERYRKLSEQIRSPRPADFARWKERPKRPRARGRRRKAPPPRSSAPPRRSAPPPPAAPGRGRAGEQRRRRRRRGAAVRLGHRLAALRAERDTIRGRSTSWPPATHLAADRNREERCAPTPRRLARLDEEQAAIAARLADAENRRGTIDLRSVELDDAARAARWRSARRAPSRPPSRAEARVAQAALEAARLKLAARKPRRSGGDQLGELGGEAPLVEARAPRGPAARRPRRGWSRPARRSAPRRARQQAATRRDEAESEAASARAALAALQSEAKR